MHLAEHGLADQHEAKAGRELEKKINNHSAQVGVIGLGYVGLPLAVEMAKAGFQVTGIDFDRVRVDSVNSGISYVSDVPSDTLAPLVNKGNLRATQSLAAIGKLDSLSICVPTPRRKTKDPDLSYVVAAAELVNNHLKPNQLIILESTTYVGISREVVLPILEKSGLKVGKDFFLAYSPDRVNAGNGTYAARNVPKLIAGITPRCMELSALLYGQFIDNIVPVSSSESGRDGQTF